MPARRTSSGDDGARSNAMLDHVLGPQRSWMQSSAGLNPTGQRAPPSAPAVASSAPSTTIGQISEPLPCTTASETIPQQPLQPGHASLSGVGSQQEHREPPQVFSETGAAARGRRGGSGAPRGRPRGRPPLGGRRGSQPTPAQTSPAMTSTQGTMGGVQAVALQNYGLNFPPPHVQHNTMWAWYPSAHAHHYAHHQPAGQYLGPQGRGRPPSASVHSFAAHPTAPAVPLNVQQYTRRNLYPPTGFDGRTPIPWGPGRSWYQAHLVPKHVSAVPDVQWLIYVKELVLQPISLDGAQLIEGEFFLSEKDYEKTLKMTTLSDGSSCYAKHDRKPAFQYFINCVKQFGTESVDQNLWMQSSSSWPPALTISCNGHFVELKRKFYWQADHPADITNTLQAGRNTLQIATMKDASATESWSLAMQKSVWAALDDVRIVVAEQKETVERTMERLRALFTSTDPDVEILTDTVSINVRDPFSSALVGCPVRSKTCEHLECFDLDVYLKSRPSPKNEKAALWRCPICGGDARPPVLITVTWLKGILNTLQTNDPDAHTILVQLDGEWIATRGSDEARASKANDDHGAKGEKDHLRVEAAGAERMVIELD